MDVSRLWKLEGDETIEDVKQMLADINGDISKIPLPVQARILKDTQKIEEANICNDELIVMELKITFDPSMPTPFVY